jgi:hypothetical protein
MKYFNVPGLLVVKYASGAFVEYRVNKTRDFDKIREYFTKLDFFRFAVLYGYDKNTKSRLGQLAYFDKHKTILY